MVSVQQKQKESAKDSVKDLKKIIKELKEKLKEKDAILKNITKSIPEIRFWKLFNPKKYEEALKSSYEMLQLVVDNIPDYIFWKDINLMYMGCNMNYAKLLGAEDPQYVIGTIDSELLIDKERIRYLGERENYVINSDKPQINTIEEWVLNNGTKIWFEIDRIPMHDSTGKSVGLLVTYSDITIKIIAEQKLIESEEKFRTIAEQSQMGIVILQDNIFKYINRAVSSITEYPIKQMLNNSVEQLKILIHPKDLISAIKLIQKEQPHNSESVLTSSLRFKTKSGKVKWIEVYLKNIAYQDKSAQLIMLDDITDKKEAERLIVEENIKLSELDRIRRNLLTRISHELKTPLISVYSGSEMLLDYYIDQFSDESLEVIEMIYRGGKKLKTLIETLLDVSRIESGKLELHTSKENIPEIISECIDDMTLLSKNRNLSIQTDLPNELYIEVDKLRINQVFTNIISNAIKNTPPNGKIEVISIENGDFVDFAIKDTGVGLTEKEKAQIFKKFGKIERYGQQMDVEIGGTGLGLYISKEIVGLHGGQIFVESKGRDEGSTFTIRLPKNGV